MDLTKDFSGMFAHSADDFTIDTLLERVQELEEQVALQSIDQLTGLLSYDQFYTQVKRILYEFPQESFVMWRFDIDKFQTVNNLFGVEEGNRLLVYCAKYISSFVEQDSLTAIGRIGADVFCGLTPSDQMTMGEEGIHWMFPDQGFAQMEAFFKGFRPDFRFSISIGFYAVENHRDPIEMIYSRALVAAKSCKDSNERHSAFYDKSLSLALEQKQMLTAEMHKALEDGQFTVYLQPKVRLSDLSLVGAEALVRWMHPTKGRIPPDSFIPIFEENGFITKLDLYVLRRCCAYIQSWMRQGMNLIPLSVNLSQMDLSIPGLPYKIQAVLEEYKVAAKYIHLEITESAYADDMEQVNGVTQTFKDLGFHLEMDDFGKGYSSLNMIAELPIDTLKLDMGFLQGDQEGSGKVISFVTGLARHMELTTVAEGIETQEQLAFLRSINCDCGQGYLFSKPMPKSDFDIFMRESNMAHQGSKVKKVEKTVAEYGGWNTKDMWNPDSTFSKMFNAVSSGLGICELGLLRNQIHLTRYNAPFADVLHTKHEILKHHCDDLFKLVHPDDMVLIRKAMAPIADPKNWTKDNGAAVLDLRMLVLSDDPSPVMYTWVRVKWNLVEYTEESRTYILMISDTSEFHDRIQNYEERLDLIDDLERQMSIYEGAGLSGTATFRFAPHQLSEIIYGNRHFFQLYAMEEEYDTLQFPMGVEDILPADSCNLINRQFHRLFLRRKDSFEWTLPLTDKLGVVHNTIVSGRLRRENNGVIYADVVFSVLRDASLLEAELKQSQAQNQQILSSTEVTRLDFAENIVYYGSDLRQAYGVPDQCSFNPEEGLPHGHLFHSESLVLLQSTIRSLMENEGIREVELWGRHPNFVEYSLRKCSFYSHENNDGKITTVSVVSRDITHERYGVETVSVGEIIDHIPDGLLVFHSTTGKLLFANDTFYNIVGMTQDKMEEEFKNYPLFLISDEANPALTLPEIEEEGQVFLREAQLKNHAMRWIEFSGNRKGGFVYGTVRDITIQKELEIQLDRETSFNVIQNSITDELLFRVNIQEKTIRFSGKSANGFGLPHKPIPFTNERLFDGALIAEEFEESYSQMSQDIRLGLEKTYDLQLKTKNDTLSWYRFEYRIVHESGEPAFALGKAVNIDYQVELLQKLERDALTGFYHAAAMKMRVTQILNGTPHSPDNPATEHALLLVTIQNYNDILPQLSLVQRDEMIIAVAEMIGSKFRDSDLVGRLSDDVFAVFLPFIATEKMPLQKVTDLYLDFMSYNIMAKDKLEIEVRCAYANRDGETYPSLVEHAQAIPLGFEYDD